MDSSGSWIGQVWCHQETTGGTSQADDRANETVPRSTTPRRSIPNMGRTGFINMGTGIERATPMPSLGYGSSSRFLPLDLGGQGLGSRGCIDLHLRHARLQLIRNFCHRFISIFIPRGLRAASCGFLWIMDRAGVVPSRNDRRHQPSR